MLQFIESVLIETIERAKRLKAKTPNVPDIHFQVLERGCTEELDKNIDRLYFLLADEDYQKDNKQEARLKEFKSVVRDFDILENVGFAALTRGHDDDIGICKFVQRICREINYPLQPPTVVCLSKDYYCIYPHLKLLCVPLLESDSLLHLPDLYHELGHPLLTEENNPKVEPYQEELGKFLVEVRSHFTKKIIHDIRNNNGENERLYGHWLKSWTNWSIEFYCDIYAVVTLGPAFAYAHLYLSLKRGGNPFFVPKVGQLVDHPNDESRAWVIAEVLRKLGFIEHVDDIQSRWNSYTPFTSYNKEDDFKHAYPAELMQKIAESGLQAAKRIESKIASPEKQGVVANLLNEAWKVFLQNPDDFIEREREMVMKIKKDSFFA
jgi:hypothetical protein